MIRSTVSLALTLAAALAADGAHAETYATCTGFIESVPATITSQGVWCLRKDVATAIGTGQAIDIAANNVTLDCNGFKIGGLGAGPETMAAGIRVSGRMNATIRHCNVRGFRRGIHLANGGGHLLHDNRLDGAAEYGIEVSGADGIEIRGNRILDVGDGANGMAYGMRVQGIGVDIRDNTVDGVAPDPTETGDAYAIGIFASGGPGGAIVGNRIRGLVSAGSVSGSIGISAYYSPQYVYDGNHVIGDGTLSWIGIYCSSTTSRAVRNVVVGFAAPIDQCNPEDNTY